MANCKSCDAEIEWGKTANGKNIPLDVTRDSRGNQIATPGGTMALVNGLVRPFTEGDAKLARDRRASHFATCPGAAEWRNRG